MVTRLPRWAQLLLFVSLILALVLAAFGRSLLQDFAKVDDGFLIVGNLAIRGFTPTSLKLAFTTYDPELYIPLTLMSFQLNYLVSGLAPWSYHLLNLLLHAANAVMVFLLLRRVAPRKGALRDDVVAITGALIFAVHPLHTEAVAWIAGRKDLLSTFFALLSILAYLRFRDGERRLTGGAYLTSIVFFLLALLAKVSPMMLPALLLLMDYFLEERRDWKAMIVEKIPFILLTLTFFVIGLYGKERVAGNTGVIETILMSGKSSLFYIESFLWPVGLSIFYPYAGSISITQAAFAVPMLVMVALLVLAYRRRRSHPVAVFGFLFYLVALAPTLPHFRRAGEVYIAADRYAYFPSLGLVLLLALALAYLLERFRTRDVLIGSGAVIGILTILSMRQTVTWDSESTLLGNVLNYYPMSVQARVQLARTLRLEKKYQESFDLLRGGIQYGNSVALYQNAGYLYAETGNLDRAREQFEKAHALEPRNPNPIFDLASFDRQMGDTDTALTLYKQVIALDPSFVVARVQLAAMLQDRGDIAGAEEQLRAAIYWYPSSVDAQLALAKLLLTRNKNSDRQEALDHLRTVLLIDSQNEEAQTLLSGSGAVHQ